MLVTGNLVTPMKNYMELRNFIGVTKLPVTSIMCGWTYVLVTGNLVTPMKNYMELRNWGYQITLQLPHNVWLEICIVPNYIEQYISPITHYAGNW